MQHILIIEDEPGIYTFLKQGLEEEGYSISIAVDGEQGVELFRTEKPDLILLDWVLPKMDGIDVCKAIRQEDINIPILFLTARDTVQDTIEGLQCGANDYIKKPFEFDELLVRIKAHIVKKNPFVCYGAVRYDLAQKRLFLEDKEIDLGSVDKEIFDLLLRNQGQLIYKEQFFDVMEKPTDLALRVHIAKLKKRLGLHVSNIKGIGYRLESV